MDTEVIKFDFELRQVKTMVDKSVNVTINLPEYALEQAANLISHIGEAGTCGLVFGDNDGGKPV